MTDLIKNQKFIISLLLIAMYGAGLMGLNWEYSKEIFRFLVPFNLIITAILLLIFHKDRNKYFIFFCILSLLTGFFIELIGVKTGVVFGRYWYGSTLGFKIWDIPIIIGINWLILVYITGIISQKLNRNFWLRVLLSASLMTFLDFWIEPVAIRQDFWQWKNDIVPLQNYVAWFVVSFVLQLIFQQLPFKKENFLAVLIYILQLVFFSVQWLF